LRSVLAPSYRALFIGVIGCLLCGAGSQYTDMMLKRSGLTGWFYTPGALILLLLVVLAANPLVGLVRRRWMLCPAELAQIYVMMIIGSAVSTDGFVSYFLPQLTSPTYYATPENNWAVELLPHVPPWLIPSYHLKEVKDLYEGAPGGVPWKLWLPPILRWVPMALSVHLAMITIMVILRKQWVERERLVFPMTQLPVAMIQDGEDESLVKPFFKNWVMWLGFAIPFVIQTNNGMVQHFEWLPRINIGGYYLYFFEDTVKILVGMNFMMVGFTFLVRREVSLGLWVFAMLGFAQIAIFAALGIDEHEPMFSHFSSRAGVFNSHQAFGAFMVLALFSLWNARTHVMQVLRQALGRGPKLDDSDEILSYRGAVIVLAACVIFMGLWMWLTGLPAWIVPPFLFLAFLLFLGITRIIAEGGVPYLFAPMIASDFIVGGFGTRALGATGIIALAFTYMWASDIINFVMVSCANGLKVVEESVQRNRRMIFGSMVVALIVSFGSSVWVLLEVAYKHGGLNTSHYFADQSYQHFDDALVRIQTSVGPQWDYWGYTAIGGAIMGMLMLVRNHFLWWPIHPIGFPISLVMNKMVVSVFIAWLIKSIILEYGGPRLFKQLRPFFLGLILGDFFPLGFNILLDALVR
jgi:hypothetical protein